MTKVLLRYLHETAKHGAGDNIKSQAEHSPSWRIIFGYIMASSQYSVSKLSGEVLYRSFNQGTQIKIRAARDARIERYCPGSTRSVFGVISCPTQRKNLKLTGSLKKC